MIFRQILVKSFEFMAGHLVHPWGAKVPDPIAPCELIESIEDDYGIRIVQPDMEVMRTMAKLEINEIEEHNDPSDHVIIAQAITMRLPLISSDHKFPFYVKQGLDLIYNRV